MRVGSTMLTQLGFEADEVAMDVKNRRVVLEACRYLLPLSPARRSQVAARSGSRLLLLCDREIVS